MTMVTQLVMCKKQSKVLLGIGCLVARLIMINDANKAPPESSIQHPHPVWGVV